MDTNGLLLHEDSSSGDENKFTNQNAYPKRIKRFLIYGGTDD